jgi:hypothetical protein
MSGAFVLAVLGLILLTQHRPPPSARSGAAFAGMVPTHQPVTQSRACFSCRYDRGSIVAVASRLEHPSALALRHSRAAG